MTAWQLSVSILPVVLLTGAFAVAIALSPAPLASDLGFPASAGELVRDVRLGVVACLAAVPPVFGACRAAAATLGFGRAYRIIR